MYFAPTQTFHSNSTKGRNSIGGRILSSKKHIPSPGGVLPNGAVYEQIQVGKTVQYAVKTDKGIITQPFLEIGEHIVYQPISPSPWLLPSSPIKYESLEVLWEEIRVFVKDHLDIENEKLYDVFIAWVLMTWITERFDSVGYLHFVGTRNSGKTRGLDILNYLCFRPLLSPSASGATVFRALDSLHPTFLLDEFEMYEKMKETKAEVIGILNAGYRRGQVVLRMTGMKEGVPTIKGFTVFGPKALSSIEELPDALRSRCIRFPMTRTFKKIRRLIDKEKAQNLRAKLLWWRFSNELDEPMVEDGNPVNLPDGRLIEMYYPLDAIAPTPEIKRIIIQCGLDQYNVGIEEERETAHAQVFHSLINLLEDKPRLMIPQKDLRIKHGADYRGGEPVAYQTMGGWLKTMGFESRFDTKSRGACVVVDLSKLENRKGRYTLSDELERVDAILNSVRALRSKQTALPTEPLSPTPSNNVLNRNNSFENQETAANSVVGEGKGSKTPLNAERPDKTPLSLDPSKKVLNRTTENRGVGGVNNTTEPQKTADINKTVDTAVSVDTVADELRGSGTAKNCNNCGDPLNNETGQFTDPKTGHWYCRGCYTTMREQGLIG